MKEVIVIADLSSKIYVSFLCMHIHPFVYEEAKCTKREWYKNRYFVHINRLIKACLCRISSVFLSFQNLGFLWLAVGWISLQTFLVHRWIHVILHSYAHCVICCLEIDCCQVAVAIWRDWNSVRHATIACFAKYLTSAGNTRTGRTQLFLIPFSVLG